MIIILAMSAMGKDVLGIVLCALSIPAIIFLTWNAWRLCKKLRTPEERQTWPECGDDLSAVQGGPGNDAYEYQNGERRTLHSSLPPSKESECKCSVVDESDEQKPVIADKTTRINVREQDKRSK